MSSEVKIFFSSSLSEAEEVTHTQSESPENKVSLLEVKKEELEGEFFEVEEVLERREDCSGKTWYFVRWAAKEEEDSWTEEENLASVLKEEFESNQRTMSNEQGVGGGDAGRDLVNEDSGIGERRAKRIRLVRERETIGDGKVQVFKCTTEGCSKKFTNERRLKIHLARWCQRTRSTAGSAMDSRSRDGGIEVVGDVIDDVEMINVVHPPPLALVHIDEEDEGDAPVMPNLTCELLEEDQRKDDSSSSSSPAGHHVADGQTASTSTSTSLLQGKRKVKVEKNEDGVGVETKPKIEGLDRKSLGAWVDAQEENFMQMERLLQNESSLRKNAQNKLQDEVARYWELEKKVKVLEKTLKEEKEKRKKNEEELRKSEVKLEEEEERRKKTEEKLMEEERRRKKAEEDLSVSRYHNQKLTSFVEEYVNSQTAQRKLEAEASKILKEGEGPQRTE